MKFDEATNGLCFSLVSGANRKASPIIANINLAAYTYGTSLLTDRSFFRGKALGTKKIKINKTYHIRTYLAI